MASWGVVSMVDEPGPLVAAFVGHHLALGAAEVHVCLDRPNPEARDLLAGVPGAVLHEDGEDDWRFRGFGRRPENINARQKYHASRILARTRLDWLLHCDCDEYLQPSGDAIAALLDRVPQAANWVQVPVAERVEIRGRPMADIFGGAFRLPWDAFETEGAQVYDDRVRALLTLGLCGHVVGKAIARSGRGLFLGVHAGLSHYPSARRDLYVIRGGGLRLMHFDGLTRLHYTLKMLRYGLAEAFNSPAAHGDARWAQIHALCPEEHGGAQTLYDAAKTISEAQAQALIARKLLRGWAPGIAGRAAEVLPRPPDLSAAAFDRALIAREGRLFDLIRRRMGFDPATLAAN
ncbi:hypothetical protein FBT96_09580 [Rhodobacter capsulatus]|uniref:Glycosyl transferase family 2 n=1 Tax=Rhodobacter capsulatus TaxID=1061 RepID=A0A4U1JQT7_RHOCA|nr:glycosyltransferase family 2 protein [Rhodobacter capsulatus]TKD21335.1 hypothetical protein FBT96_09580 [Rhodobacter capsulatus]